MWTEFETEEASSDESGKGDFFGGMHVCACYIDAVAFNKLKDSGILLKIKDSKKISNTNIKKLGSELLCILEDNISVINVDVKKFNEFSRKFNNLNTMNAYVHNLAWIELVKKTKADKGKKIIDDFCTEQKYYEYLEKIEVSDIVKLTEFSVRAESKYISCAIASIISRYFFIQEIENLSKFGGVDIPFGCSYTGKQSVIDAFHNLQTRIGPSAIECCKQCFKTIEKLDIEV